MRLRNRSALLCCIPITFLLGRNVLITVGQAGGTSPNSVHERLDMHRGTVKPADNCLNPTASRHSLLTLGKSLKFPKLLFSYQ